MTEKPIEQVRAELAEFLKTPASYPLVMVVPHEQANLLIRRAFSARERRFTGQPITGFDQLQEQP